LSLPAWMALVGACSLGLTSGTGCGPGPSAVTADDDDGSGAFKSATLTSASATTPAEGSLFMATFTICVEGALGVPKPRTAGLASALPAAFSPRPVPAPPSSALPPPPPRPAGAIPATTPLPLRGAKK
ncbi:hypothetical protein Vretimale_15240, partial [Volvox reticuliferus]